MLVLFEYNCVVEYKTLPIIYDELRLTTAKT